MASELITVFEQKLKIKEKMIDSLPNEMLRAVLNKLDANKLIACRQVSRLWNSVIVDICRDTRSIVIMGNDEIKDPFCSSQTFNGLVQFNKKCATFIFTTKPERSFRSVSLSSGFFVLLTKLFPVVEDLIIVSTLDSSFGTTQSLLSLLNHRWSSSIVNLYFPFSVVSNLAELSDHMDNLSSLKHLHDASSNSFGPSTLARLEHCAVHHWHLDKVIPQLGSSCTSLSLCAYLSRFNLTHLYQLNPRLFKGLTRFNVTTSDPQVLPYICDNFTSLQMMHIDLYYCQLFDADVVAQLARLTNLTELSIVWFQVDLAYPAKSGGSLKSVRILSLSRVVLEDANQFNGDQFCRALSAIFPNLHQLTIHDKKQLVRDGISKHLNHFENLRKYRVVVAKY